MPSPRTSPALRPTSPLSPRYDAPRYDTLQPPSPRSVHTRQGNSTRRANTNSLKLPSLPRFHPANFPSAHSSVQTTPDGNTSPQAPISPRAHHRMYSDAQKQLFVYHRESIAAAQRDHSPGREAKPTSPRLVPLGSPGPVTPLALEQEGGYLMAGVQPGSGNNGAPSDELVERLILEEARQGRGPGEASSGEMRSRSRVR